MDMNGAMNAAALSDGGMTVLVRLSLVGWVPVYWWYKRRRDRREERITAAIERQSGLEERIARLESGARTGELRAQRDS
jgi:hypothetical protein